MKYIQKNEEPEDFAQWRTANEENNPEWNDPRVRLIRQPLRESLMSEQGFICSYCGTGISQGDSHIEHIRPQSEYPDSRYDYNNMLASCQCNLKPREPRHCGHAKDNWFDEELFVSPLTADCEQQFRFTAGGDILPNRENNIAASTTIEKLALNIDNLRAHRKSAIEAYIDIDDAADVLQIIESLEELNRGKFEPFCFAITHVLKTFVTE